MSPPPPSLLGAPQHLLWSSVAFNTSPQHLAETAFRPHETPALAHWNRARPATNHPFFRNRQPQALPNFKHLLPQFQSFENATPSLFAAPLLGSPSPFKTHQRRVVNELHAAEERQPFYDHLHCAGCRPQWAHPKSMLRTYIFGITLVNMKVEEMATSVDALRQKQKKISRTEN